MHQKGINHTLVIENAQIFWQQGDIPRELHMQRGISTNVITPYGLDGSGIEIFRTIPELDWGPTSLLFSGYQFISRGKATGAWS